MSRTPDFLPQRRTIRSVSDVPDYSTPAGAAQANEEMRRLSDAIGKLTGDTSKTNNTTSLAAIRFGATRRNK